MPNMFGINLDVRLQSLTNSQIQELSRDIESKLKPIKIDLDIDQKAMKTIEDFNRKMGELSKTAEQTQQSIQRAVDPGKEMAQLQRNLDETTKKYQQLQSVMRDNVGSDNLNQEQRHELEKLSKTYGTTTSVISDYNSANEETRRTYKLLDEQSKNTVSQVMDLEKGTTTHTFTEQNERRIKSNEQFRNSLEGVHSQIAKMESVGYGDKKQIQLFKDQAGASKDVEGLRSLSREITTYNGTLTDLKTKSGMQDTIKNLRNLHSTGAQRLPRNNMLDDLEKRLKNSNSKKEIDDVRNSLSRLQTTMRSRKPLENRVEALRAENILPESEIKKVSESLRKATTPEKIRDIESSQLSGLEGQSKQAKAVLSDFERLDKAKGSLTNRLKTLHGTQKITTEEFNSMSQAIKRTTDIKGTEKIGQKLFEKNLSSTIDKNTQSLSHFIEEAKKTANFNVQRLKDGVHGTIDPKLEGQLETSLKGLNSITQDTPKARQEIGKFQKEISRTTTEIKDADQGMARFGAQMQSAFLRIPIYAAGMALLGAPIKALNDAIKQMLEIDKQMVVLDRVSDGTINVNDAMQDSVRIAEKLGNTIAEVNEGFISFARQGYRGDDLTQITEIATMMSNVSDLGVEEASSSLTAAMKGFNIEAKDSVRIVDAMNEVNVNQPLLIVI